MDEHNPNHLEHAAETLLKYVAVLRGQQPDFTGLGLWQIFQNQLEHAANVHVITEEQWQALKDIK